MKQQSLDELKRLVRHFDENKQIITDKEMVVALRGYIELQEKSYYYDTVNFSGGVQ